MKRQTSLIKESNFRVLKVLVLSLSLVISASTASLAKTTSYAEQAAVIESVGLKKEENKLIKKAVRVIKKTIKRAKGTPCLISCQYKIKNNKPVSASTEVRYLDYRKQADQHSIEFAAVDGELDRIVEFVYKPNQKTLAVVERDPTNMGRRLTRKKVSLDL
ncbi:hypothetical protein FJ364_01790 [Candidatus Dependentiae bacterium]|nr:hypothetical protein [Candidatus Dependentiae bacterium]